MNTESNKLICENCRYSRWHADMDVLGCHHPKEAGIWPSKIGTEASMVRLKDEVMGRDQCGPAGKWYEERKPGEERNAW